MKIEVTKSDANVKQYDTCPSRKAGNKYDSKLRTNKSRSAGFWFLLKVRFKNKYTKFCQI